MFRFGLELTTWEEGRKIKKTLTTPDRWEVHAAETVVVTLGTLQVTIIQQPTALTAKKVGVGACLWDGALALAAYLVAQPQHRYVGAKVIELGAGVGLVSLALAKLGAKVLMTDRAAVVPLMQQNAEHSGFRQASRPGEGTGHVEVCELEWGAEGYMERIEALRSPSFDYVLAADCCYIDQDGESPSTTHFVNACAALCMPGRTRCLVASEIRSAEVRIVFLSESKRKFSKVQKVNWHSRPLPPELFLEYVEIYELTL